MRHLNVLAPTTKLAYWSVWEPPTRIRHGETIRVFPLSNWTELDIWNYIRAEQIPVVPLYFAKERPVVRRGGKWIMMDDERSLEVREKPQMRCERFRTLGCYPLTGAIESDADSLDAIVAEMLTTRLSKPQRRRAVDAITITLTDQVDVTRGGLLMHPDARLEVSDQFAANLIWMGNEPLVAGRSYLLRLDPKLTPATITAVKCKIDVNTRQHLAATALGLNDIGFCNIATGSAVAFDPYQNNRRTGSYIIIDRFTNHTIGVGMISFGLRSGTNVNCQHLLISRNERSALKHQRPAIIWLTGLSGARKSTIANLVEQPLHSAGYRTMLLLHGDNVRHGLNRNLGITKADRVENIRRVGEVVKLITEAGLIVLCPFISPYRTEREMVRKLAPQGDFIEIFVAEPLEECMQRDPKGLYAKAKTEGIANFTGLDAPYEPPETPEIHRQTSNEQPKQSAEPVVKYLADCGCRRPKSCHV